MEDLIESILTITDDPKRDYFSDEAVSQKLFELLTKQLQQGGVVRAEVESAKEGGLLPESDGEANKRDWMVCNCVLYKELNRKICGKYTGQDCCA